MGFTCRYLERKQNKTKHTKKQTPGEEIAFGSVLLQFMLGNSDVTDKQVINVMLIIKRKTKWLPI